MSGNTRSPSTSCSDRSCRSGWAEESAARRAAVLITEVDTGRQRLVRETDIADDPVRRRLEEHLDLRKSGLVEQEGRQFFANVQIPPIKLLVVGAVHVSQALAPMAAGLGLAVTIIDPCRGASGSCQAMLERAGTCATVREWWNGP